MFTAEDILVAEMGSDANCTTTLRLKKDATFNETSFCFGLNRITGYYQKRNDTIWFNSTNKYYQFGIIGPTAFDSTNVYINLYKNRNDTLPYFLKLAK